MSVDAGSLNLTVAKLNHIRRELDGYYTGDDLDKRVSETMVNFTIANANPLDFQFMEESRYNQDTFKVESWLGWKKKEDRNGSILIKD